MERPSIRRSVVAVFLAVAMIVGTVVLAKADQERGRQNREHERWMTGDWHQHTFFTDGSNFMGDVEIDNSVTPPSFKILTHKYTNAAPDFTPVRNTTGKNEYKGGMAQGFRYGLDFQANSEHGGNRGSRDGFGRFWVDPVYYPMGVANIPLLGVAATYSNVCSYLTVDSPGCTSPRPRSCGGGRNWQIIPRSSPPRATITCPRSTGSPPCAASSTTGRS